MDGEPRNVYVKIWLKVKPGVDIDALIEEMDYSFPDEENCIIESAIVAYGYRSFPEKL